ncbi:MAG: beta-N-acetylhexosaminidase [Acetatifactor sp.]|nr:beta-N-acetylhexosaminidase [Acetatifactor sp.]
MFVLPQPREVKLGEGNFSLNQSVHIYVDCTLGQNANVYAGLLKDEIKNTLGFETDIIRTNKIGECAGIYLSLTGEGEPEAYVLSVDGQSAELKGADEAGLLYAVQTLRQLIREYGAKLPVMEITDQPAIPNRGFNHDVTRGRIPTLEQLKKLADTCSFYKINQLQLNVEHSYLFQNESEVWRGSTPLTAEEIMELDSYCRTLHIDLVPTLASFGHLYELLRSRTYSRLCELNVDVNEPFSLTARMGHHTVDVTNPDSFTLIASRIREYMNLFSSRYFNICADETFDLGKGKSKEKVEKEGVKNVYIDFLKKLCDYVIACGKIPMYWGDIIVEKPEIIKVLPEQGICLNWEYSPEVKEDNLKKLSGTGVKNIFVCPGVQGWNHMINRHADAYRNISGMCINAHKYQVKGVLNTDWGDLGHIGHPEFSTVGLIYGAAFSWSDEILSEEECNRRISAIQYGDFSGTLVDIFRDLGDNECVNWWHFVQYKEEMQKDARTANLDIVMSAEKAEIIHKNIAKTDELIAKLYVNLHKLPAYAKQVVNAYILMAEGQKLLGHIGATLRSCESGKKYPSTMDNCTLAVAWEKWFMKYKELWRTTSKESELYRLSEVVFWYADRLRDLQ